MDGPHPDAAGIAARLSRVRAGIDAACRERGRDPAEVTLVAVSKTHSAAAIRAAWDAGQRVFGESYPKEFRDKRGQLADLPIRWHFIGHAQRNKVKWVAGHAELCHSVGDPAGIAEFERRCALSGAGQDVLLQVNLLGEASKRGCPPGDVDTLVGLLADAPHLRLRGLMTMPPAGVDPSPLFAELAALKTRLQAGNPAIDTLSMGMTGDFAQAIAAGATHVRVGTAIFGARSYPA